MNVKESSAENMKEKLGFILSTLATGNIEKIIKKKEKIHHDIDLF